MSQNKLFLCLCCLIVPLWSCPHPEFHHGSTTSWFGLWFLPVCHFILRLPGASSSFLGDASSTWSLESAGFSQSCMTLSHKLIHVVDGDNSAAISSQISKETLKDLLDFQLSRHHVPGCSHLNWPTFLESKGKTWRTAKGKTDCSPRPNLPSQCMQNHGWFGASATCIQGTQCQK